MSSTMTCLGVTIKGKRCNKKTLRGYCKYHISQKNGDTPMEIITHEEGNSRNSESFPLEDISEKSESSPLEDCCVCTDPVEKGKEMKCKCNATIHMECVIKSGKSECPVCRRTVRLKKEERDKMNEYATKYKRSTERDEFHRFQNEFGNFSNRLPNRVILQPVQNTRDFQDLVPLLFSLFPVNRYQHPRELNTPTTYEVILID